MEISSVSTVSKPERLQAPRAKRPIESVAVSDRVSFSSNAEKIEKWVNMLKEMPDIRSHEVNRAMKAASPSPAQLASRLLQD